MKRNKDFSIISKEECLDIFNHLMNFFIKAFDLNLFRNGKRDAKNNFIFAKKINPAIFDSICAATVFCYRNNKLFVYDNQSLSKKYIELLENDNYQRVISQRTTNTENIKERINLATSILYGLTYEW